MGSGFSLVDYNGEMWHFWANRWSCVGLILKLTDYNLKSHSVALFGGKTTFKW